MNAIEFDENPYASPHAIEPVRPPELPVAIWVHHNHIVAHRKADWPRVCVVSGADATQYIKLTFPTQYSPWLFFAFFGSLAISLPMAVILVPMPYKPIAVISVLAVNTIGIIIALIRFAQPMYMKYYVSNKMLERRKWWIRTSSVFNLLGAALFIVCFLVPPQLTSLALFAAILMLIVGGIVAKKWNSFLVATKMRREYIIYSGAGTSFLALLPPWPFGQP